MRTPSVNHKGKRIDLDPIVSRKINVTHGFVLLRHMEGEGEKE